MLQRILELDPTDAEARQALAGYAPREQQKSGPTPMVVEDEVELIEDDDGVELLDDEDEQVLLVDDHDDYGAPARGPDIEDEPEEMSDIDIDVSSAQSAPKMQAVPARESSSTQSIPPEVAREAQIARLLTECEVFLRYGLKAKVIEQLLKVIDIAPGHVEAREKLKEAYLDQGKIDDAIRELYALAAMFEDEDLEIANGYYRAVLDLDPSSEPARSNTMAPASFNDTTAEEDDSGVLFVEEPADEIEEDLTTMDGLLPIEEGAPAYASEPAEPDDTFVAGPPATGLAPMSPEEFEAAPLRPSSPGDVQAARERVSMPPGEVEEILEEAEFFVAQGLLSEARGTLKEALSLFPDHPILMDKLTELAELELAESSEGGLDVGDDDDESFLLAEKLAEELGAEESATEEGSDVLDVESVFAQFKKGVEEQIGLEDTDTHFDLGIAYKEMGLLEDAIHEFGLSKGNPQRECIAYTMIGLCYVEKGEISEAISFFKKGLYADHKSDREELGLYFELGAAYELLHDPKEALYYYQKVMKREPKFRNVGDKVKSLTSPKRGTGGGGGQSGAPTKPQPSIEDVDRAFDDLMGDD
jgi:tetratricopeptide (TPR) repeat protein